MPPAPPPTTRVPAPSSGAASSGANTGSNSFDASRQASAPPQENASSRRAPERGRLPNTNSGGGSSDDNSDQKEGEEGEEKEPAKKKNSGCCMLQILGGLIALNLGFILLVLAFLQQGVGVAGLSGWIDKNSVNSGTSSANIVCGTVPDQYKAVFDWASSKWNVRSAFIAAMFYAGEHGNSWPRYEEHAKLGTSLNPTPHNCNSDVGCIRGPMQIGERNWPGWTKGAYGSSQPADRIEWTRDSIFVAAYHLAMTGAGGNTGDLDKLRNAASIYNSGRKWGDPRLKPETLRYVPRVIDAYLSFLCESGPVIASSGRWVWPIPFRGTITAKFGVIGPSHPKPHKGLDIAAPSGTPIRAVASGRVISVVSSGYNHGYGVQVVIDHGNGFIVSYNHMLNNSPTVAAGQTVNAGQTIGKMGSTGFSTGPHLHLQVEVNGKPVDPMHYLN